MERIDDLRMQAWRSFLFAHARVLETLERELEDEQGLSLHAYEVVLFLRERGGRMRMQELADAVLLSKSGLTRLVDRMEKDALVRRVTCATDRRGVEAELTDEGLERLRAASPTHLRGVSEHFTSHLTEDEARAIVAALGKVLAPDEEPGAA